jgi:hypothetical protein
MPSVYFLVMEDPARPGQDFGFIKIGLTDGDVPDRVAQLQTGNPFILRCIAYVETASPFEVEHFPARRRAKRR